MSRANGSPGTRGARTLVRSHSDLLDYLPDPPETFVAMDLPERYHGIVRSLCRDGVIEKVGFTTYDHLDSSNNDRREYRVSEWGSEVAAEIVAERDAVCPCGHSGVSNKGDHYECAFGPCSKEFSRDELEVDA